MKALRSGLEPTVCDVAQTPTRHIWLSLTAETRKEYFLAKVGPMGCETYSSGLGCGESPLNKKGQPRSVANSNQFLNSVVTGTRFPGSIEAVWEKLMFYEQIERRPPWLLRLLLPIPVRTEGRAIEI